MAFPLWRDGASSGLSASLISRLLSVILQGIGYLILSGCVAASPAVPEATVAQADTWPSDDASSYGDTEEDISPDWQQEVELPLTPRKFDGLDTLYSGPITVRVRMAQPADLQNFGRVTGTKAMTLMLGSIIVVGGAFGAAALPLLGAYAAWGTIFFGGVAPGMSAFERHRQASIAEAIAKVDFPNIAQVALQRRLGGFEGEADADYERGVEVVVLSYGFTWAPGASDRACSFLQAQIRLTLPDYPTQEDWVYIEPSRRSDDAPPAYCTYIDKLFDNDSELARKALSENAEILAAIVAKRLKDER